MMPAAKHFDPILGVDIHIIQPPGPVPPIPIPHPFIGIVMDPFDYVPIIGATVMVNGIPRAQAGTEGKALPSHIPIGGTFIKPPANECETFMGSSTVAVDGDAFTHMVHPVLSCQDIGMPPPFRSKKKSKTNSLVLPVSVVLPIPAGAPVLVGGPPTISLMAMGMKAGMAGLSRLGRGLRKLQRGASRFGKAMKKMSKAMRNKAKKVMDKLGVPPSVQNKVNNAICSITGHPVDIATGKVFTKITDFELPGPIPFKWERIWFSTSVYQGPLGHGWHHNYDLALIVDDDSGAVAVRMSDGRPVAFPALEIGQQHFDRTEKLFLFRDESGYLLRNSDNLFYRFQALFEETDEQKLITVEDLAGNAIQFRYGANKQLSEITDSGGRILRIKTNEQGRITTLSAPHPNTEGQWFDAVRYVYDEQGDLIESIDALDQKMRYQYENHLLIQETDRNGLSFYFSYEGNDHTAKCIRTWGDKGIYDHKLTFIEAEGLTIVENSLGNKSQHYWNSNGLVIQVIDARGGVTETEYNEFNEKISETDPLGNVTAYNYDEFGNQTEIVGPDGAALKVKYDQFMNPIEAVDTIGGKWFWEYDQLGRLVKRTNSLGEATTYEYTDKWLTGILDPIGARTGLSFDEQGNLNTIVTADGAESRWHYDALGQAIRAIDPKGNKQLRQFDSLGRVAQIREPDGNQRLLEYDPEGNVIHVKDKHHDVKFAYSGMGRMTARGEAGTTVQFAYDTEEQLIGIKNEHDFIYKFQLDENGEVAVESGFDEIRRVYTRDAAGRVESVQRASGLVTAYQYDPSGRVTAVNHSDGSKECYQYRLDGELVEAINDSCMIKFERDVLGRVLKEWQGEDYWVTSEYNSLGLRIHMSSSFGANQSIQRNVMGDVIHLGYTFGQQNEEGDHTDWELHFKRDIMGLELERQLPGGIRSRWDRDKLGRPLKHQLLDGDRALRDVRYVWDVNDRLRQVIDAHKGITKYQHDALGNLASAQYADGVVELRMPDAVGNLFKTKGRKDRKYGPAGQLLESYSAKGTTYYSYDAEGNLTGKKEPDGGEWQYHWNATGMLESVVRPDREIVRFSYDALGRRIAKTFQGRMTRWIWDGNNPLHEWVEKVPDVEQNSQTAKPDSDVISNSRKVLPEEHPPTGPPSADYANAHRDELISNNLVNTPKGLITWLFEPESFSPVAKIVDDKKYSIITDYLGTPVAMMDQGGNKVWSADISIYGELRNLVGEREDCPFRWPGQYEDIDTGLYYNRCRYYDSDSAVYLSIDPLGLVGGIRYYAYVHDTVCFFDPLGLIPVYRNIRSDQNLNQGLSARQPGRNMSPAGHIMNGSNENFRGSQFQSATTDPSVAASWRQPGQTTVTFDTDDVVPDSAGNKNIIDVSTPDKASASGLRGRAYSRAVSSKEVLIEGHVPSNKVKKVCS